MECKSQFETAEQGAVVSRMKKAIEFLQCPKCGRNFSINKKILSCCGCRYEARLYQNNIFSFEESKMPKFAIEKTMYGPKFHELEKNLENNEGVRLAFGPYISNQNNDMTSLDYGCGSSRQVFDLADYFKKGIVFGLDYDLEPLNIISKMAKEKNYDNIFLIQYRSANLPFKKEIFEVVTSHQVLEHVPDPRRVVGEIGRVIKKDGIFDVDFPNGKSLSEAIRSIFHKMAGTQNPHISRISLKKARKIFKEAGFRIRSFESNQALTGPMAYFVEGFVLRFLLKRREIWSLREKYQKNVIFRILRRLEKKLVKNLPTLGHAYLFILEKI